MLAAKDTKITKKIYKTFLGNFVRLALLALLVAKNI